MRTIIGNSGGLDSTYALWKLLSTTNDEVTVVVLNTGTMTKQVKNRFDVRSFNSLGDSNSRSQRVQNILNWLSANVRPCTVVNVDLDENVLRRGIDYPNNPQTAIVEWAIAKINTGEADKVIVTTERENDGYSNGGTITTRAPGAIAAKNLFVEFAARGEISFMLLDSGYHQGVALREMPQALIDLTHSVTPKTPSRAVCASNAANGSSSPRPLPMAKLTKRYGLRLPPRASLLMAAGGP